MILNFPSALYSLSSKKSKVELIETDHIKKITDPGNI